MTSLDFSILSKMGATGFFATFLSADLLMKESSGRQACRPILPLYPLQHTLKCALGNGACVLVPKVIPVYGYSHAPQISDITGRFILRGQVNELHPCVPAVCQYEIVFHFACFFQLLRMECGRCFHRHALKIPLCRR